MEKGKYWTIKRLFGDRFDYVQPMVAIDCQSASLFVSNNKHNYQHQANDCLVSNLISYNDVLLVVVILLNMAFCVIVGPKDGYTTTNTILIINANAIMAIIINICLMLLDVVFCVIVCPEDGGATQPNKW